MFSAEEYFECGKAKAEQGDLPGAIADLDKAIKLDPDYAEAWGSRGAAKSEQGDLPGAIADLDKAIKLKPDYAKSWYNRGLVKYTQEDLPGAIADYDEAIKLDPDLVAAWGNRGVAKIRQGDLPGAIADYDEAIKLDPNLAKAWNYRGTAKEDQEDMLGAIADYDEAIKLDPNLVAAWVNRGIAKEKQGDLPGAIVDYDEAIKFNPDLAEAWSNRGIAKAQQGDDLPGAIADLDKAIKLDPDLAEAWSNRGIAKAQQGDLPSAIVDSDEAIKLKPDLAEAWICRGIAKALQGDDLPGAIVDYDKAIQLKPDLVAARFSRAVVRDAVRAGVKPKKIWDMFDNARSAIDELRQALENKKKDPSDVPMHYTNLDTLLSLVKGGKFRLYNAKSMDDGEEGKALFELFDEKHQEKICKAFRDKRSENLEVFIGSFVTASNIKYGDDLMWRTYGKHNGEERAGCALVFDKKQPFSSKPPPLMNLLEARLLEVWSEGVAGEGQGEIVPDNECYLYPVCYKPKEIQDKVDNLCEALVQLCDEEYEETCKMVAVLLNHVRYLFKHDIYQREQEYRLTIVRARKSPAVKEDLFRTYIEYPLKMKEIKVLLGSAAKKYVECSLDMKEVPMPSGSAAKKVTTWKQWLEEKASFSDIQQI